MPQIKVLAAEDDELHADTLRMLLDELGYKLIAITDKGEELLRLAKITAPDVLLMDIDLGEEESGIDLVKKINQVADIPVIYLTAFKDEETFKKARETMPEAYINKPYSRENLLSAIELAVFRKQKERSQIPPRFRPESASQSVFVKDGVKLVKINLKEIDLVEAYDKYCYLYQKGKKLLLNIQMKRLVESLPGEQFIQVHRSFVVNLDSIEGVRLNQNLLEVEGKVVPVSKSFKENVFSRLKIL
jgi:DNA-binding LytR/AlgR family response regulator